jgi:hypothetical protein
MHTNSINAAIALPPAKPLFVIFDQRSAKCLTARNPSDAYDEVASLTNFKGERSSDVLPRPRLRTYSIIAAIPDTSHRTTTA